jgi:hypothetical protein
MDKITIEFVIMDKITIEFIPLHEKSKSESRLTLDDPLTTQQALRPYARVGIFLLVM